jgi:hypothetical protein
MLGAAVSVASSSLSCSDSDSQGTKDESDEGSLVWTSREPLSSMSTSPSLRRTVGGRSVMRRIE